MPGTEPGSWGYRNEQNKQEPYLQKVYVLLRKDYERKEGKKRKGGRERRTERGKTI